MAIIQATNTPVMFLSYNSKTGVLNQSVKGADGKYKQEPIAKGVNDILITKIEPKDDMYENAPLKKVVVTGIMDKGTAAETRVIFEANMGAGPVVAFVCGLNKADLSLPLGFVPTTKKAGYTYVMADGKTSDPLKNDFHSLMVLQSEHYVIGEKAPKSEELKNAAGVVVARDASARTAFGLVKIDEVAAKIAARGVPVEAPAAVEDAPKVDLGNEDDIPF